MMHLFLYTYVSIISDKHLLSIHNQLHYMKRYYIKKDVIICTEYLLFRIILEFVLLKLFANN